jgi:prepilin-type N-terminal cleavage/methylation domain-containing protein
MLSFVERPLSGAATRRSSGLRTRKGLSLAELLIVISIMGIMLGLGLPRFVSMTERAAVSSARDRVLSALNTARTTAVRRGATSTFNASTNEIWVTVDSAGTEVSIIGKISLLKTQKVTMATSGNTSKIQYNMRGLSSASSGRIRLSRGTKSDSVCVTALGGATKLSCL